MINRTLNYVLKQEQMTRLKTCVNSYHQRSSFTPPLCLQKACNNLPSFLPQHSPAQTPVPTCRLTPARSSGPVSQPLVIVTLGHPIWYLGEQASGQLLLTLCPYARNWPSILLPTLDAKSLPAICTWISILKLWPLVCIFTCSALQSRTWENNVEPQRSPPAERDAFPQTPNQSLGPLFRLAACLPEAHTMLLWCRVRLTHGNPSPALRRLIHTR